MEITFSRKVITLTILVLLFVGLATWLLAFGGIGQIRSLLPSESIPVTVTAADAKAAADGAAVFYTLSSSEGADGWLDRVCAVSTETGCGMAGNIFKLAFATLMESKSVKAVATAIPLDLVEEGEALRVWRVQVTLDNPWEGFENPQTVYILVAKEDETWTFERVLFEQEAQARYASTPTP